jgi:hypothetical protein
VIGSPPLDESLDLSADEVAMTLTPDPQMWVVVRDYHDGSSREPLGVYGVCTTRAEADDLVFRLERLGVPDRLSVCGVHRADRTQVPQ